MRGRSVARPRAEHPSLKKWIDVDVDNVGTQTADILRDGEKILGGGVGAEIVGEEESSGTPARPGTHAEKGKKSRVRLGLLGSERSS